jgi:hypothetical protein
VLPTFLGIAAPKAGTTWLYELLDSHPDVVMSTPRKEVHYFDLHFERGHAWYEGFFPVPHVAPRAVGEFTPHYLYSADALARVRGSGIDRFVLALRNPVDRAFSHYRFRLRQDNRDETFEEFVVRNPDALGWGRYGEHLARWLDEFDRHCFLVLVFETAVRDTDGTKAALADHLGFDPNRFPATRTGAANESFVPRRSGVWAAAVRHARWLRRHDFDRVITMAKRAGVVRRLKSRAPEEAAPVLDAETRARLWDGFEPDVRRTEQLTGLDLALWRP